MALYDTGQFHVDHFLTNVLVGYRPQGLIADQVYPVLTVKKESNIFAKVNKGDWFRRPVTLRAPGATANEVSFTVSSDRYQVHNYELATVVPWETIDNADDPYMPMTRASEFLTDQLKLDNEIRVRTQIAADVGSTTTLTGADAWDQFGTSDPLTDIDTAKEAIRSTTGYRPNVCICGVKTWEKLKRHPDIVRGIYPGAGVGGVANESQFANLIGVSKMLVPEPIYNTADEGPATTDAFVDVWSSDFTLLYVAPNPGIMIPTFGYQFNWTGANIGNNRPTVFAVRRRRNEKRKSEELEAGYYADEKLVAAELGFNIKTGIT